MTNDPCYHACPRCHGTGGPDDYYDEELCRRLTFVCSSCGGSGDTWHWAEDTERHDYLNRKVTR